MIDDISDAGDGDDVIDADEIGADVSDTEEIVDDVTDAEEINGVDVSDADERVGADVGDCVAVFDEIEFGDTVVIVELILMAGS